MERLLEILEKSLDLSEEEAEEFLTLLYEFFEERKKQPQGITSSRTCKAITGK